MPTYAENNERAQGKVAKQAAFELECPQDQLTVTLISDDAASYNGAVQTWGVRGCGKKATFKSACVMGLCNIEAGVVSKPEGTEAK